MFLFFMIPLACWDNTAKKIKRDTKAHLWYAQNTVLLFDNCHKPSKIKINKNIAKENLIEMSHKNTFDSKKSCDKYTSQLKATHEMCTGPFSDNVEHPKAPNDDPEYVEAKQKMSEICAVIELAYNAEQDQTEKEAQDEKDTHDDHKEDSTEQIQKDTEEK